MTGTIATHQVASGDYFSYLMPSLNVDNVLAVWETAGDALWNVKIDILGVAGSDVHQQQLYNTGPVASIDIDVLAGNCGKFDVGTLLAGNFVATDNDGGPDYLARYTLGTEPFAAPVGAQRRLLPPGRERRGGRGGLTDGRARGGPGRLTMERRPGPPGPGAGGSPRPASARWRR